MSTPPPLLNETFVRRKDTPDLSLETLLIAGIKTRVYGVDEALASGKKELAVVTFVNPRKGDYRYCRSMAHELIREFNAHGGTFAMIGVCFDAKNHGERLVDADANDGWPQGNKFHGQDMVAVVKGSAEEAALIINYLPAYLAYKIEGKFDKIHNIMSGVSQGGHATYRVLGQLKSKLFAAAPVIGSPFLGPMMLERVESPDGLSSGDKYNHDTYPSYDKVVANFDADHKEKWPRALHELLYAEDEQLEAVKGVPVFALNGAIDRLVPPTYARKYAAAHGIDYYEQPDCGHKCSQYMIYLIGKWLADLSKK